MLVLDVILGESVSDMMYIIGVVGDCPHHVLIVYFNYFQSLFITQHHFEGG